MGKRDGLNTKDIAKYFEALLALLVIGILVLVYVFFKPVPGNRLGALVIEAIPSAIVVLIGIVGVYFFFYRQGLTASQLEQNTDIDDVAQAIADKVANKECGMNIALVEFYETYRGINWPKLLAESHNNIDIIVYYYDSWVNANYEHLVAYFRKPRTAMRVFVADPNDDFILGNVSRLFPEYTRDEIKGKVERTGQRIMQAVREAGAAPERFEFYYVPHVLNYSAQCMDDRTLILSVFEMYRKQKIDSPAFLLDLTKSAPLASYWNKELAGLVKESQLVRSP